MSKARRAERAVLSSLLLASLPLLPLLTSPLGACAPTEPAPSAEPAASTDPVAPSEPAASTEPAAALRASPATSAAPSRSFVPGELILRTKLEVIAGVATSFGGVPVVPAERLPSGAWRVLLEDPVAKAPRLASERRLPLSDVELAAAELATRSALAAVAADPDVQLAYFNGLLELSSIDPTLEPFYPYQRWNYEAIRLPQAWQRAPQTSSVRLAIIDSDDANLHPDLVDRMVDAATFDPYTTQTYHHGLHVAGIAGASAGNGYGVGVCWQCKLAPYKVSGLSFSQLERAIVYAAGDGNDPPRVHAMNLSLNYAYRPGTTEALLCAEHPEAEGIRLAIARAVSRNVAVVVSAGNHSLARATFPANCPGAISVAGIQPNGALGLYSNHSQGVTLAAPGGGGSGNGMYGAWLAEMPCQPPYGGDPYSGTLGVVAPWASYEELIPNGKYCYRYLSGTSMAAPHVTGTIGLMLSRHGGLTAAQVRDLLVRTARPTAACPAGPCGAGLLNAEAAVRYAVDGGVPQGALADHDFGSVAIGQTATGFARITNSGSAPLVTGNTLTIAGSTGQMEFAFGDGWCSSGQICTRPSITVPPGGSFDLPIRCRPTTGGLIEGTLLFSSNSLVGDTVDATLAAALRCNGYYALPKLSVLPSLGVTFGPVVVGGGGRASITISNDNASIGATLHWSTDAVQPPFSLTCIANCSCSGGSCTGLTQGTPSTLRLTFTPPAAGSWSSSLVLRSDDPVRPVVTLPISGSGVP